MSQTQKTKAQLIEELEQLRTRIREITISDNIQHNLDITTLRESEERFRTIYENAPVLIDSFDTNGRCILWNKQCQKTFGWTIEELNDKDDFLSPIYPEPAFRKKVLRNIISEPDGNFRERQAVTKTGDIISAMWANYILPDGTIMGLGYDITERKLSEDRLKHAFNEIQSLKEQLEGENVYLREEVRNAYQYGDIVSQSKPMKRVIGLSEQVATTDSTVLIMGETGTGKELFAHAIHDMSSRKNLSLVILNCAALPATLIESELFGREKGAYTGALTKQIGRFEIADKSTIFLDEIGELPIEMQTRLLRFLQEGQFERLGSTKTVSVDVRIIAATNRNLEKEVKAGRFREDLFYRLNVFPIVIPPLRERKDDIPQLVWSFVKEFSNKMGKRIDNISKNTMNSLQQYYWPGNVRELRNFIERGMIQSNSKTLQLQLPKLSSSSITNLGTLDEYQKRYILEVLEITGWKIRGSGGAAEILDLKPTTLESKMKRLNITRPLSSIVSENSNR
jgi:PAS domain S-box-containing protein